MAIGSLTSNKAAGKQPSQSLYVDSISFDGDDDYATGGFALEAALQTLRGDSRDIVGVVGLDCGGYVPVWDPANSKVKVYQGNNDGGADGPLVEVAADTDLSAVTFNLLVLSV